MHLHIALVRTPQCNELITKKNYSLAPSRCVGCKKEPFFIHVEKIIHMHKISKVLIIGSVSETFCLQVLVCLVLTEKKGSIRTVMVS